MPKKKTSKTDSAPAVDRVAPCSPVGRVEWQAANLYPTNGGDSVDAWILSVNGRPILHAVALSEITEPVSAEDRKMIGQAIAEYLANVPALAQSGGEKTLTKEENS